MHVLHVAPDHGGGEHVAQGAVLPARHDDGEVLLAGGDHPAVAGIDLVVLLEHARAQEAVEELVGEVTLAPLVGAHPLGQGGLLDAAHGLHLGDAGVGDAVHVAVQERLLVRRGEVPVVGHALVEVVGHQVEHVLFQVRARAGDEVHLVLADHLREAQAQLGRAHGPRQAHHHLTAVQEVGPVPFGRVHHGGGVEVAVVVLDERSHRTGDERGRIRHG